MPRLSGVPDYAAVSYAHRSEGLLINPVADMRPDRLLNGLSAGGISRRIPSIAHSFVEIAVQLMFWTGRY